VVKRRGRGETAAAARATVFAVEAESAWRVWLLFALLVAPFFVAVWAVAIMLGLALMFLLLEPSFLRLMLSGGTGARVRRGGECGRHVLPRLPERGASSLAEGDARDVA